MFSWIIILGWVIEPIANTTRYFERIGKNDTTNSALKDSDASKSETTDKV